MCRNQIDLKQKPLDILVKNNEDPSIRVYIHVDEDKMLTHITTFKKSETGNGFSVEHLLDYNSDGSINKIVRQKICDILTSLSNKQNKTWSVIEQKDEKSLSECLQIIKLDLEKETD